MAWWRHKIETFPAFLALYEGKPSVTGGLPTQRPVTPRFAVFFDLRLNKRLYKQSRRRLFETSSRSLWRHCNGLLSTNRSQQERGGGWGCEVSCGGHHRPRGKTTTGSALDGAVFDIAQILAYLVHNMSRSQLYLGFGHFGWLPSFFGE